MRPTIRLLLASVLSLFFAACSSLSITSQPGEAELFVMNGREAKPVGKTPYSGTLSDLDKLVAKGPWVVQVRRAGYLPQDILVPNASGADLNFQVALTPLSAAIYSDLNRVVRLTLAAERQLLQNQLEQALATAAEIRKVSENAASAYEIEGSAYFLKGELEKSLAAWRRSLEIDPDNPDAAGMVKLVEAKLGKATK